MAATDYQALSIEKFGGLNTLIDPTNLPPEGSPDTQNCEYVPGLVRTRPGLQPVYSAIAGNPTINYVKTYITPARQIRTLALDSLGILYKEDVNANPGILTAFYSSILHGSYCNSVTQFGREYMAFGDGQFGIDVPRQYDDSNLYRISQSGPGVAPTAGDENVSFALLASPNGAKMLPAQTLAASPNGVSESGNVVTVYAAVPYGIKVGNKVRIAGVGVGGYNGDFTIASIDPVTPSFTYYNSTTGLANSGGGTADFFRADFLTTFTTNFTEGQSVAVAGVTVGGYNGAWTLIQIVSASVVIAVISSTGLADSGGGTISASGNIVVGTHQVSVVFQTPTGYLTKPAPPTSWIASGGKRAFVSNIHPGPPGTVARILLFTAAGGDSFYYTESMIIPGNSIASATIDFSDEKLLSGTSADYLFDLVVLGECSGITTYSGRTVAWGELNKVQNFLNMDFDGGFGGSVTNYPLGWTPDSANYAGGGIANSQVSGNAYRVSADGVTAIRAMMTQSAYQDYLGVPILQPNVAYSIRARIAVDGTGAPFTQGSLHIHLYSASGGINTIGITLLLSSLTTSFESYSAVLTSAIASPPSDLVLRIYADGTPIGGQAMIDCLEVYPTNQPYNTSILRLSGFEDPETFDGTTGFLQPSQENGQRITTAFTLRDFLYVVKERSLFVTADDGQNEPNSWSINEVSTKVGTLSVRGVGLGDEWAIIAGQNGVYYFDGGIPQPLSLEIQPTWDAINWNYGYLLDVKVDTNKKQVYIAVPYGNSSVNSKIFMMDFKEGFGPDQRKWNIWTISQASMDFVQREDGTMPLFIGNGMGTGAILKFNSLQAYDSGTSIVPIDSYWQSGYFQSGYRMSAGYLTANVVGSGLMNLSLFKGDQSWLQTARGWILNALGIRNMERQIKLESERISIKFGTSTIGAKFSLQGVSVLAKRSSYAPVRGVNAP